MAREIEAALDAALDAAEIRPVLLVEIETSAGPARAWTGLGDLVWGDKTFLGVGTLGGVTGLEEASDGRASGVSYNLSGVDDAMIALALSGLSQSGNVYLWFAALDAAGQLIGAPRRLKRGFVDVPEIQDDGETATIRLNTESRAIDQRRPRVLYYTPEDQALIDEGDKGFDFVAGLQDATILWGRR